jgi:hypothetical protein
MKEPHLSQNSTVVAHPRTLLFDVWYNIGFCSYLTHKTAIAVTGTVNRHGLRLYFALFVASWDVAVGVENPGKVR